MDDTDTIQIKRPQSQSVVPLPPTGEIPIETKYPSETIELPSKGQFYAENNPLSKGQIEVKMITAKEEDILTNTNLIRRGQVLDKLLESVLIDKRIKIEDFLISDVNAVYIALRRLAYGDKYGPLAIVCSNCKEENKDIEIDLSKIAYKNIDVTKFPKGHNEFSFVLPFSKKTITFKLLTSKDEAVIESEIKVNNKLKLGSNDLSARLKQLITSVDGNSDRAYIRKFIENDFLSKDSFEFRKYLKEITPAVDMGYDITCPHCNSEERVQVPLTAAFFWPDTSR